MKRISFLVGSMIFNLNAQEPNVPPPTESEKKIAETMVVFDQDITVTATKTERNVFDVAQPVTVLKTKEIEKKNVVAVADTLSGETGVYIQQTGAGQGTPIIRGLLGSSTLFLVDGVRFNNAMFRPAPNQYFSLVDGQFVERVELIRGAGSALYGSDAMGGIVNIITPMKEYLGDKFQSESRVVLRSFSATEGTSEHIEMSGGKKGKSIMISASHQNHQNISAGGNLGELPYTAFESNAANIKYLHDFGSSDILINLQYVLIPELQRFDSQTQGFGSTTEWELYAYKPNMRSLAHIRYRKSFTEGFLDQMVLNVSTQKFQDDRTTQKLGSSKIRYEENSNVINNINLIMVTEAKHHTLSYGIETYNEKISASKYQIDTATGVRSDRSNSFADGSTLESTGAYLQDEWKVNDKFDITVGARTSYYKIKVTKDDRAEGADLSPSDTSGNFSLTYKLNPALKLITNYGRGFRVPNLFDLSNLGSRPGNRYQVPNDDLKTEKVDSTDIGIKMKTDKINLDFFVFQTIYKDKITDVSLGSTNSEGEDEYQSENINELTVKGIELAVQYYLKNNNHLYLNINEQQGEEKGSSTTEPGSRIPPLNGRFGYHGEAADKHWYDFYAQFAQTQGRLSSRDKSDPRIDPDGTQGWMTFNIDYGFKVATNADFSLSFRNISNQEYREHASGVDAEGLNIISRFEFRF